MRSIAEAVGLVWPMFLSIPIAWLLFRKDPPKERLTGMLVCGVGPVVILTVIIGGFLAVG